MSLDWNGEDEGLPNLSCFVIITSLWELNTCVLICFGMQKTNDIMEVCLNIHLSLRNHHFLLTQIKMDIRQLGTNIFSLYICMLISV